MRRPPENPVPSDGKIYPWVAKGNMVLYCLNQLKNAVGEGFVALDGAGRKYFFDWMATQEAAGLIAYDVKDGYLISDVALPREEVFIFATRVEDRFGNYIEYEYDSVNPFRLKSITSSEGGTISVQYDAYGNIRSASALGKIWNYALEPAGARVSLPDGTWWLYEETPALRTLADIDSRNIWNFCQVDVGTLKSSVPPMTQDQGDFTITHPSGLKGKFRFRRIVHGTNNTAGSCTVEYMGFMDNYYQDVHYGDPKAFPIVSIYEKTLSGPGILEQKWRYEYEPSWSYAGSYPKSNKTSELINDCPSPESCRDYSITRVFEPGGRVVEYMFGNDYSSNTGLLLRESKWFDGSERERKEYGYVMDSIGQGYPESIGWSAKGSAFSSKNRPLVSMSNFLDGEVFYYSVEKGCGGSAKYCFDRFVRSLRVKRSNSQGFSQIENVGFDDRLDRWILGRETSRAVNGIEVATTEIDELGLPKTISSFGKVVQRLSFDTGSPVSTGLRGTLRTVTDGNNNVTTYGNWKRGIPQSVQFADGASQTASVNDSGWIDWVQNEVGARTCYAYDAMGRLAQTTYPSETSSGVCDESKWVATRQTFAPSTEPIAGLPAGHWRQTMWTGNARSVTYFDALWRPVIKEAYDTADIAGTLSQVVTRYDSEGRPIFVSYPQRSMDPAVHATWGNPAVPLHASTQGVHTEYDALGRVTAVAQDSEFAAPNNLLITLTQYLPGFQTKVTNPRGQQTITTYQMYDTPTYDFPVRIEQPEGVTTVITRDVFGKPTQISR